MFRVELGCLSTVVHSSNDSVRRRVLAWLDLSTNPEKSSSSTIAPVHGDAQTRTPLPSFGTSMRALLIWLVIRRTLTDAAVVGIQVMMTQLFGMLAHAVTLPHR